MSVQQVQYFKTKIDKYIDKIPKMALVIKAKYFFDSHKGIFRCIVIKGQVSLKAICTHSYSFNADATVYRKVFLSNI